MYTERIIRQVEVFAEPNVRSSRVQYVCLCVLCMPFLSPESDPFEQKVQTGDGLSLIGSTAADTLQWNVDQGTQ